MRATVKPHVATDVLPEPEPASSELDLTKIFAALADPARLAAVRTLAHSSELACTRLQTEAGLVMSRSTFSHHQKVLREAGIIKVQVRGARRLLSLRRDELDDSFPGLLDLVTASSS